MMAFLCELEIQDGHHHRTKVEIGKYLRTDFSETTAAFKRKHGWNIPGWSSAKCAFYMCPIYKHMSGNCCKLLHPSKTLIKHCTPI
jgi:hypothetical protein